MVVTPRQAKHLRCPYGLGRGSGNSSKCVGQQCMFWRWIENVSRQKTEYGYCGGAGMPLTGAGI